MIAPDQLFPPELFLHDMPMFLWATLQAQSLLKKKFSNRSRPLFRIFFLESFPKHLDQLKTVTREENREAIRVMAKHGVKIIAPSSSQLEEFKSLSNKAMVRSTGQTFSQKVYDEVTSFLEHYRKGEK